MSIEAERHVNDTPPTAEQLLKLASIGVSSAVARERFRTIRSRKGVHYLVDEVDFLSESVAEDMDPAQIRHRVAMRVAAYPANEDTEKKWSLKYFDTFFVENQPGVWRGERSTYRFEWTRSRMLMAERSLLLFGFNNYRPETLNDDLEHFYLGDDSAAILQAAEQMRAVTTEDCEELIGDMSAYFDTVNTIAQA